MAVVWTIQKLLKENTDEFYLHSIRTTRTVIVRIQILSQRLSIDWGNYGKTFTNVLNANVSNIIVTLLSLKINRTFALT